MNYENIPQHLLEMTKLNYNYDNSFLLVDKFGEYWNVLRVNCGW